MRRHIKRTTTQAVGVAFILFGTAGLVLPIIQGVLFLIIGFLLLSVYSPRIKAYIERFAFRHPSVRDIILKAEKFIVRVVGDTQ
jgi:uncharacterized protein